ncbi:hypothetical protein ACFWXK_38450 [Streptomyces sp. NPDC059070]|uniref:hypothetical protein n=1 Tax=unclassified Streptomyces TaxID=2593676 RepID=UPI0034E20B34
MEAAIAILALAFVAFVALGVYLAVKAARAAKRGVERTVTQARKAVEDTTLRAKSMGQTGVASQLAQLRLSLRTSMRATQDALHAGVAHDESLKESIVLFERLSGHGHELDDELKRLEREPDRTRTADRIPELRERTERITHAADSLRWAARDRARQFSDDDLAALSAEIEVESGALRDWATKGPTTAPRPGTTEPTGVTTAPGADRTPSTPDTGRSWADPAPAATDGPQAIPAPQPAPTYPWQKTVRPETTT